MIHNKDEQISVSEDSIPVYPLATTYIGLQREQLIRLPAPSNYPCTESYPAEVAVHLTSEDKQKYSKLLCQDVRTIHYQAVLSLCLPSITEQVETMYNSTMCSCFKDVYTDGNLPRM